jgi:hypothetical protein
MPAILGHLEEYEVVVSAPPGSGNPAPGGCRKVVLATDVAETAVLVRCFLKNNFSEL